MKYSEPEFCDLCKDSCVDLCCLPTFMIVLEFIRFLDAQGNPDITSADLKDLFQKAELTEPMNLRRILPSAKQIDRHVRTLIEKKWLSVLEKPNGHYKILGIHLP